MRKKENVPAFHDKGYEAKHNDSGNVKNYNPKSVDNMSIKIHESNTINVR